VGPDSEIVLVLGLFACGTVAGLLAQRAPLSGWVALLFPAVLPPLGIELARLFC
jgi:hypothetical protein